MDVYHNIINTAQSKKKLLLAIGLLRREQQQSNIVADRVQSEI